jgi:nitroreductase
MPLEKPAETSQPVIDVIRDRWSPRAFTDRMVPRETLISLFEAARWAASCNNSQPWRFIVATKDDPAEYEKLLGCFNDRNQSWAVQAPVIMIVCAYKFLPDGRTAHTHWYDSGAAMAQFTAQATSHGLHVHQMQGILYDRIPEVYDVPDDYDVCTGVALGYQGDGDTLPESYAAREPLPRERHPLNQIVFTGRFGKSSSIVG